MLEDHSKAKLVDFLLEKKHGIKKHEFNILSQNIEEMNAPKFLLDLNAEKNVTQQSEIFDKIEKFIKEGVGNEKLEDLLFGILYSTTFPKDSKNKDCVYQSTIEFYKKKLIDNKKIMSEFHRLSSGKFNFKLPEKIVTRFPPEANGFLHIGHVKAAVLNSHLAKEGSMLLRFDDTNPIQEDVKFEKGILEDLKLLDIKYSKLVRTSDHFKKIEEYAKKLIKTGKAYVEDTDLETMREQRMNKIASKNRNTDVEENLTKFNEMLKGKLNSCLRAKVSYDSLNTAMRDPVIYRKIDCDSENFIFPTYDFACPIVDSLDGVTLALRSNEYKDRNELYNWVLNTLELENKPKIQDFSRLNFENTVLSKRKIKFYVENKYVDGWDDPRLSTLRGIKRRGMSMKVLKDYIISQGASQKTSVISWDKLWSQNKKYIDSISPRVAGVPLEGMVRCVYDKKLEKSSIKIPKIDGKGFRVIDDCSEIFISQEDALILEKDEEFT
ncbi:SYEC [Hepatospora eriocheir]|uniref:Probable glutamate--tRNA ligase, cytoplasmic n=1 Tax=Hepatospora eriocheir TaxID=1081669 RepID=A0A1X0Q958_9MICR|nr:SYEC [Hepatospora eriocheir]